MVDKLEKIDYLRLSLDNKKYAKKFSIVENKN